jgi:hypothetical protein
MAFQIDDKLTPREYELMQYEKEENNAVREHAIRLKELEIEVSKVSMKWQQVFTLPLAILLLPVRLIAAFALVVAYIRKYEPSESFWKLLK